MHKNCDLEYRYAVTWCDWISYIVGLITPVFWCGFFASIILSDVACGIWPMTQILLLALLFACATAWSGWNLVRLVLEVRRASIRTHSTGITATDWRGRQTEIPWAEISEMQTITLGGLYNVPIIKITAPGRKLTIGLRLQNRESLANEIIARTTLKPAAVSWSRTRYKPAGEQT